MPHIHSNSPVGQIRQTQSTSSAVGTLGAHSIRIGTNPPISLSKIPSKKIPFAGFRTATKVANAAKGVAENGASAVRALTRPGGRLDVREVLASMKAMQTHLDRQFQLGKISRAGMDDAVMAALAPIVEQLGNIELSAVYQSFTSGEMSLLQEGLLQEIRTNPGNRDAKAMAANLFNLEALVLKETSNRVAVGSGMPGSERLRTLSETYAGRPAEVLDHVVDMTSANLKVMVETAAQSATSREKMAAGMNSGLEARNIQGIDARRMGDVLRSSELTMNVSLDLLCGDRSPLDASDRPWENAFHLSQRGVAPHFFTPTYMDRRDAVERTLFPEFSGHAATPDERPTYAALNLGRQSRGAAGTFYGHAVLIMKPEVAQRATYMANDTFMAVRLKITPERREAFYRLVPGLAGRISTDLAAALADGNAPLQEARAKVDRWLDDLASLPDPRAGQMDNLKTLLGCTVEEDLALQALCVEVFGDAAATRANTATFDSLESLIPNMGEVAGAQVAHAAIRRQAGADPRARLSGLQYIEAQIQGPLVLDRDVAEIRVDAEQLGYIEKEMPGGREKLLAWGEAHGVPIRIVSMADSTGEELVAIENAGVQFSAEHLDRREANARAGALLTSPEALRHRIEAMLHDPSNHFSAEALALLGDELPLQGAALSKVLGKFQNEVAHALDHPSLQMTNTESLINICFNKAVLPMLESKMRLLKDMEGLEFDNPAQKAAFRNWVLSAGALTRTEEMTMIHARATEQCRLLMELGENPDAAAVDRFVASARATDRATATYFRAVGFDDFGPDDSLTELNRVSFLSAAMLKAQGPEALEKARAVLDSPAMRSMAGLCERLSDPVAGLIGNPDFAGMSVLGRLRDFTLSALCKELGTQKPEPPRDKRDLAQIPHEERNALHAHFPQATAELDRKHPYAGAPMTLAPFPAPLNPQALPPDQAGRRAFLLGVLPTYLGHEENFDRDYAVHGRNHVIRSFIFATAMANILAESGVPVDRNAVLCGIAGHDMGREGNGNDVWEGQSAAMTRDAMRRAYGEDSMGAAYEGALMAQIDGHAGRTAEAMILQAADSLDIGRTQDFDPSRFPFLREGVQIGSAFIPADEDIRRELTKEADILQRITNPLASVRQILEQFILDMANAPVQLTESYMGQIRDLHDGVRADFERQRLLGDEELLASMETAIRDNPDLFPLLHKYYD